MRLNFEIAVGKLYIFLTCWIFLLFLWHLLTKEIHIGNWVTQLFVIPNRFFQGVLWISVPTKSFLLYTYNSLHLYTFKSTSVPKMEGAQRDVCWSSYFIKGKWGSLISLSKFVQTSSCHPSVDQIDLPAMCYIFIIAIGMNGESCWAIMLKFECFDYYSYTRKFSSLSYKTILRNF